MRSLTDFFLLVKLILAMALLAYTPLSLSQDAPPPNPNAPVAVTAAADDEEDEEEAEDIDAWKAERDEIEKEIRAVVKEWVEKNITRQTTTMALNAMLQRETKNPLIGDFSQLRGVRPWVWPTPEATATLEKIVEDKRAEAKQRVDRELPDSKRKAFEEDAKERYKMFKERDRITFVLRGGFGTNTQVDGIYFGKDSERVHIGSRYIARIDLDADTEAKFYQDLNIKRTEEYIRRQNERYDAVKENKIEDYLRDWLPKAFQAAEYVPDPFKTGSSARTSKSEYWVDRLGLHTKIYQIFVKQATEARTIIETKRIFEEREWVFAPNAEEKNEWMPKHIAERIQQQKTAAAAPVDPNAPPADPNAPPPMDAPPMDVPPPPPM